MISKQLLKNQNNNMICVSADINFKWNDSKIFIISYAGLTQSVIIYRSPRLVLRYRKVISICLLSVRNNSFQSNVLSASIPFAFEAKLNTWKIIKNISFALEIANDDEKSFCKYAEWGRKKSVFMFLSLKFIHHANRIM